MSWTVIPCLRAEGWTTTQSNRTTKPTLGGGLVDSVNGRSTRNAGVSSEMGPFCGRPRRTAPKIGPTSLQSCWPRSSPQRRGRILSPGTRSDDRFGEPLRDPEPRLAVGQHHQRIGTLGVEDHQVLETFAVSMLPPELRGLAGQRPDQRSTGVTRVGPHPRVGQRRVAAEAGRDGQTERGLRREWQTPVSTTMPLRTSSPRSCAGHRERRCPPPPRPRSGHLASPPRRHRQCRSPG